MKSASSKNYHMIYEIKTEFDGEEGKDSYMTQAEVTVSEDKSLFRSDEIDIYKDSKSMASINKEEHVIYLSNAVTSDWKKIQTEAFSILHDTLLNKAKVTGCQTSCPPEQNKVFVDKVDITFPEKYIQMMGIESISYWIESKSKKITRCLISYRNHPMGIHSVDFAIKEYDDNYKGVAYDGDALSKVMRNNKVIAKYKDYQVKDIR